MLQKKTEFNIYYPGDVTCYNIGKKVEAVVPSEKKKDDYKSRVRAITEISFSRIFTLMGITGA